jgi:hypothetical protein
MLKKKTRTTITAAAIREPSEPTPLAVCLAYSSTLKMGAEHTSTVLIHFYHTTHSYVSEDSTLQTQHY